jgi:hypothetical protein
MRKIIHLEKMLKEEQKKRLRTIMILFAVLANLISMSTAYMYTGKFFPSNFLSYNNTIWDKNNQLNNR